MNDETKLADPTEVARAIELWNGLTEEQIKHSDPFNGRTGRSGAAAYNFLLLTTAGRVWTQPMLDRALPEMQNFVTAYTIQIRPPVPLTRHPPVSFQI